MPGVGIPLLSDAAPGFSSSQIQYLQQPLLQLQEILKEKEQAVVNADLESARKAQARQNSVEAELEKLRKKAERKNRRKSPVVGEAAVADIVSD